MSAEQQNGPRMDWQLFHKTMPEFAQGMTVLKQAMDRSGIEPEIFELIKIRASQLNGCAFCVQYHLNDARKLGISAPKLDLLAAWRETDLYSERERAALEWTEVVTLLAAAHISDEAFARLKAWFSEEETAFLTAAIAQINCWNRIAAPLRFTPPIPATAA